MPAESAPSPSRLVLVVGVGSAGSRHLANLRSLGHDRILLCRSGRGSPAVGPAPGEYEVVGSLDAALARAPWAVIVANPTALHVPTALQAARAGAHLFIEKPLSHSWEGVDELVREVERRALVAMVAYQFRFHPGLRAVKAWLEEGRVGRVVSAHAFWGEYLPGWHPWEDYRSGYSARKDLGGGVVHTLSHPIDYLWWLLGPVEWVSAETGRLSTLEVEVEDVASLSLRHASGSLSRIYLDFARRPPRHDLEVVGTMGTIRWDNGDGVARLFRADTGEWTQADPPPGFERNHLFVGEMEHFLGCLARGKAPECGVGEGVQGLRVALAAHQSAEEGRRVHV